MQNTINIKEMGGYWGHIYVVLERKKGITFAFLHHFVPHKRFFKVKILQQHIYPQIPPFWEQSWTCEGGFLRRWTKPRRRIVAKLTY